MKSVAHSGALIAIAVAMMSCSPGKRPFLQVQMCLVDGSGIEEFTSLMKSIARSENMEFTDGSQTTSAGARRIGAAVPDPLIHLSVEGREDVGVIAGNMGFPSNQVTLGFQEGRNPTEARQFAERVVNRLQDRWDLVKVPTGEGAHPLDDCQLPEDDLNARQTEAPTSGRTSP